MAVVKYSDIKVAEIDMDGAKDVAKAAVIGPAEGWRDYALRVFRLGPGGFTPRHQHDWEHVNYVIRGRGRLTIGNETFELTERDFAFVPPNIEHQFENPYEAQFEFICIVPKRGA